MRDIGLPPMARAPTKLPNTYPSWRGRRPDLQHRIP
jgi:hypothetical protein